MKHLIVSTFILGSLAANAHVNECTINNSTNPEVLKSGLVSPKDGGIKFKGLFLTLGTHPQGAVFNYTIDVESTGFDPLQIKDVTASEPWIEIVSFPTTPINKGHYGKIVLRVTVPIGETGRQIEKVTVLSNTFMGKENVNIEFEVTNEVVQVNTPPPPVAQTPPPAQVAPATPTPSTPAPVVEPKKITHNPNSMFTCDCAFKLMSSQAANGIETREFNIHVKVMYKDEVTSQENYQIKDVYNTKIDQHTINFRDEANPPKIARLSQVNSGFIEEAILMHMIEQNRLNTMCKGSYTINSK